MNPITPEQKASLRSRLIVAAILIVLIVPSFFVGQWLFFGIVAIFLALATTEMIMAPHKPYKWYVYLLTYVMVFSYVYWFVFKGNFGALIEARHSGQHYTFSLENYFRTLDISIVGIASSIFLYCLMGILDKSFSWGDVAYFITFTILLGLGFQSFFFCRYYPFYMFGSNPTFSAQTSLVWRDQRSDLVLTDLFKYLSSSALLFFVILITTMNDARGLFRRQCFWQTQDERTDFPS
jgi:hypothetical protein